MLLIIDIGNTGITLALFKGRRISSVFRIPTNKVRESAIQSIRTKIKVSQCEAAVIASVVPSAGNYLRTQIQKQLGIRTFLIGKDMQAPVRNLYKNPKQVGMDRLMNAVAVHQAYKRNTIVIDFGTAITFDAVSAKGEYLGGVIAPGIEISLNALYERTALLPKIKLAHPKAVIGRDTIESIRSGCSYGMGGLCDRIVLELRKKLGRNALVIATGGYAYFMSQYCTSIRQIDPDLVLRGIFLTYQKNS